MISRPWHLVSPIHNTARRLWTPMRLWRIFGYTIAPWGYVAWGPFRSRESAMAAVTWPSRRGVAA